jgi:very-short-patch-repair endonuclease
MTPEERRLWWYLRDRFPDVRWRRQEPIGPFIADFVCYAAQLVVEVDGSQHLASDCDWKSEPSMTNVSSSPNWHSIGLSHEA